MSNLTDYTSLVVSEHADKPDLMAVLSMIVQPMVDGQNMLDSLIMLFDLDTAEGDQLDVVGQWIGLGRSLTVPITGVYFSFDIVGVGFDEGVWFVSGDPAVGVVLLDDSTYRLMLLAKIASNTWDGSLGDANAKLLEAFPGADVFLQDNFDMTETFILSGTAPSKLFAALVSQGYIELKPAGVNVV